MKYKTTQVHEVEIGAECTLAVQAFIALKRAERLVEKKEAELQRWLSLVPKEELEAYVGITSNLEED